MPTEAFRVQDKEMHCLLPCHAVKTFEVIAKVWQAVPWKQMSLGRSNIENALVMQSDGMKVGCCSKKRSGFRPRTNIG